MVARVTNETLEFLRKLKLHNDRGWFNANKEKYTSARENFIFIVQALIDEVSEFDESVAGLEAESTVFRIYRDVRFSRDKSPYKTHFAATLKGRRKNCGLAGYYVHLEPGSSFLAGGVHLMEPRQMAALREEISDKGKEFLKIINAADFKETLVLEGEKLARVPHGFDKQDPMGEYLKYKYLMVRHALGDKDVLSGGFVRLCTAVFKTMVPFNAFVNEPAAKAESVKSKSFLFA